MLNLKSFESKNKYKMFCPEQKVKNDIKLSKIAQITNKKKKILRR